MAGTKFCKLCIHANGATNTCRMHIKYVLKIEITSNDFGHRLNKKHCTEPTNISYSVPDYLFYLLKLLVNMVIDKLIILYKIARFYHINVCSLEIMGLIYYK